MKNAMQKMQSVVKKSRIGISIVAMLFACMTTEAQDFSATIHNPYRISFTGA